MKEITQAFMNVLIGMKVQDKNIKAITQFLCGDIQAMNKVIAFIKENPQATESEIIKAAVEKSDEENSLEEN